MHWQLHAGGEGKCSATTDDYRGRRPQTHFSFVGIESQRRPSFLEKCDERALQIGNLATGLKNYHLQ